MGAYIYAAGTGAAQRNSVHLRWRITDPHRRIMVTRFCEFWCQQHALGEWNVQSSDDGIEVSFDQDRDHVLFALDALQDEIRVGAVL